MRPRLSGVLFDKDGTLLDFAATWRGLTAAAIGELAGGDPGLARALGDAAGYDVETGRFRPGSPIVAGATAEVAALWSEYLPRRTTAEIETLLNTRALAAAETGLAPVPGLGGALARLAEAGLALGVATHDSEAAARAHLARIGEARRFAFVAGYDSGWGLKPGPGMVTAFAAAIGAPAEAVAMVGDSRHDLEAGRAAGAGIVIGVLTGPAGRALLAPLADVVLPSAVEAADYLAGRLNPT